jgi:rRNA processing protein Krr1/Pno1
MADGCAIYDAVDIVQLAARAVGINAAMLVVLSA